VLDQVTFPLDIAYTFVYTEGMNYPALPKFLTTTDQGVARHISTLQPGDYIWHKGAFRLVTGTEGCRTVRMGRYVLHSTCPTVESVL
jgi:hypothetical protein